MKSTVTVGLPVVNEERTFPLAVRSIFAQLYTDWRLIVVCDGASDLIREMASKIDDDRVTVLDDGQRIGLPRRLNQITEISTSQYIARMDADDVMHPDRIRRQVDFLDANPEIDLVGTRAMLIDDQDRVHGLYREPESIPDSPSGFLTNGVFTHPTVMFRREWGVRFPYRPDWVRTEDKEVWLRASAESEYWKMSEALLYYRVPLHLSIRKQGLTARYDRRLVRLLGGQYGASFAARSTYQAKSFAKQAIFGAAIALGQGRRIHARKSLFHADRGVFENHLQSVRQVHVPGWPTPDGAT